MAHMTLSETPVAAFAAEMRVLVSMSTKLQPLVHHCDVSLQWGSSVRDLGAYCFILLLYK